MAGLIPFNKRRPELISTGFSDFQNMLDDFFAESWPFRRSLAGDTFKIDVQETDKEYIVEAELPGVQKDQIDVMLNEGRLTITANKEENLEQNSKNYFHRERRYSSMTRSVFLGDSLSDGIKGKLEDGLLIIHVPKKEKPNNSMKIDIE
jgi:HSP20 family protein